MAVITPSFWLVLAALVVLSTWIYRASIPKPLPGVPYNKASAARPFGDIPDAVKWHSETGQLRSFFHARIKELDSPIIQLFMRPFSKRPWIVIADSREAQDIMVRRNKEFDRSPFLGDLVKALMPFNQVTMLTSDTWRSHRRLMADTMSPSFLQNVAAVRVHAAFTDLISLMYGLWTSVTSSFGTPFPDYLIQYADNSAHAIFRKLKMKLAQGHPFEITSNIEDAMLDTITAAAISASLGGSKKQEALLSKLPMLDELSKDKDAVAVFPRDDPPEVTTALRTLANSSEIPMNSPLGYGHHLFATKFYPSLRQAAAVKDRIIVEKLDEAWRRLSEVETDSQSESTDDHITSAADLVVSREIKLAKKEGRDPQYKSRAVQDELFGFVEAGHDTTGTTIQWGIKFLSAHPDKQRRLREELRTVFSEAASDGSAPRPSDIAGHRIPYLDAFIEEILRVGNTAVANTRLAVEDTEILGYQIPKGTNVFMLASGPSTTAPAMKIDKSKRGTSGAHIPLDNPWIGNWDESTLAQFEPDRWLIPNEKGELEFEPRAGPQQNFGAGLRGCFGRRLAMLALRIVFTLMVWNFNFESLPEDLGSMDAQDILTHTPKSVVSNKPIPLIN